MNDKTDNNLRPQTGTSDASQITNSPSEKPPIEIKKRERTAILRSLKSGTTPKTGLLHIQVGRNKEIHQICDDLDCIADEGGSVRFLVGEYGSGKTFFLTLSKLLAHAENLVVVSADITMDKLLCSATGKGRLLFSELISQMSTKNKPEGGALKTIIEKWADKALHRKEQLTEYEIRRLLAPLDKYPGYSDFCTVITQYLIGYQQCNDVMVNNSIRWLRAEYTTKTEAQKDLNVRSIISDETFYDYLRLYAEFVVLAGYRGLLVCIDELAVLARLISSSRNKNYERILTIVNDVLQGTTRYLGFLFCGTPQFVTDKRVGLFSYGALQSRLETNIFASDQRKDFTGPVIELSPLTVEELFTLFQRIRNVFALGDESQYLATDAQIQQFIDWIYQRKGADAFLSPRESVKHFVGLLTQLENYPDTSIDTYLGAQKFIPDVPEDFRMDADDIGSEKLTNLKL